MNDFGAQAPDRSVKLELNNFRTTKNQELNRVPRQTRNAPSHGLGAPLGFEYARGHEEPRANSNPQRKAK